jgi:hypothetical protein
MLAGVAKSTRTAGSVINFCGFLPLRLFNPVDDHLGDPLPRLNDLFLG